MRMTGAAIAAIAIVSSGAAFAADGALSGMGKNLFGSFFHFPKPNIESAPVDNIKVGSLNLSLQHTRLNDIKKVFGGTVRQQGNDAQAAYWLCYHTDGSDGPAANVWFMSNSLGGREFVMMVAMETAASAAADCEEAPSNFKLPVLGIPGLGASQDDLKDKFGAARTGSGGAIAYRADEPGTDALGTSLNVQYIGYIVKGGKVTGVGVGESSAPPS